MTVTLFITLLTIFSTIASLFTQGVKEILNEKEVIYSSNLLATIIAFIVGIGGTAAYYILFAVDFSAANITCMILMGLMSALGSMVGYDKVTQLISQTQIK